MSSYSPCAVAAIAVLSVVAAVFENQLRLYVPRASDAESIGRRERDCDGAVRQAGFRRFIIGLPKVPRGMFERRITVPYRGRMCVIMLMAY